jgi:hypothetical protein
MVGVASLALWFIALALNSHPVQSSCGGTCPPPYGSVCVERRLASVSVQILACRCGCVSSLAAGEAALRQILMGYGVSSNVVDEAVRLYREIASQAQGEFSFTVSDRGNTYTIRGQPFGQH